MQALPDTALLQRWRDQRDAQAFKALTQRYGELVYGICNRVLRNPADAEEVTQDCFLKLALKPDAAERAVGPWLHSVAVRGALDRIRVDQRRRKRESAYEDGRPRSVEASADDLLAHVDAAIDELPDDLRACVVGHFLVGRPQDDLAGELSVSTRTIRRRTEAGIDAIRRSLEQRGITAGAGVLAVVLAELKATALPSALEVSLGKIAIGGKAHVGAAASGTAVASAAAKAGGLIVMKKAAIAAVGLVLLAYALWSTIPPLKPKPAAPVRVMSGAATESALEESPAMAMDARRAEVPVSGNATPPRSAQAADAAPWSRVRDTKALFPEPIANPAKHAAIAGVVLDEQGVAIPGAGIRALFCGDDRTSIPGPAPVADLARFARLTELSAMDDLRRTAVSDAAGAFSLDAIPYAGLAIVAADAPGFTMKTVECALEPETTTELTLTLRPALAVHGVVVTPSGRPVADALIDSEGQAGEGAAKTSGPTLDFLRVRTDSRGEFTLWMRDFGDSGSMSAAIHVKSNQHGEALFYPVPIGNEEPIRLVLQPELGRLTGTIQLREAEPAAGYHLLLRGSAQLFADPGMSMHVGQGHAYEAITDALGNYAIENIASFLTYNVTLYSPNGQEAANRQLPEIQTGKTTVWDYIVAQPIHITGRVRGEGTGAPIPGAVIFFRSDDVTPDGRAAFGDMLTADANGAFSTTITSGEGTYRFIPRLEAMVAAPRGDDHEGYYKSVELHAGENPPVILELPLPWTRQFQLADQFGQPVEGVSAMAGQPYRGDRMITFKRPETTDANGFVSFGLLDPRLETEFTFSKDGYIPVTTPPVLGGSGETLPVETVVLYQCAGLSARLMDPASSPLASTPVTCTATYGDRTTRVDATTDAGGWLVLDQALPGTEMDIRLEIPSDETGVVMQALFDSVTLAAGTLNEMGDVILAQQSDEQRQGQ